MGVSYQLNCQLIACASWLSREWNRSVLIHIFIYLFFLQRNFFSYTEVRGWISTGGTATYALQRMNTEWWSAKVGSFLEHAVSLYCYIVRCLTAIENLAIICPVSVGLFRCCCVNLVRHRVASYNHQGTCSFLFFYRFFSWFVIYFCGDCLSL